MPDPSRWPVPRDLRNSTGTAERFRRWSGPRRCRPGRPQPAEPARCAWVAQSTCRRLLFVVSLANNGGDLLFGIEARHPVPDRLRAARLYRKIELERWAIRIGGAHVILARRQGDDAGRDEIGAADWLSAGLGGDGVDLGPGDDLEHDR